ncbi:anaerobic ribonucleoside-triphosphate reductase activating protein [endosymbiont of Ridgeia piscesae]|jgi:pyruvate formate lyase activating enzyme|uniref:Anaerobic ribonucleoside-triphosphate reductase activating protein n=2 Tax=endosymbiont of Ridgeia piscesae TaxID=54398 RepID=A0A0T5Z315_9GAMM|nr:anaerobic ribonucleoside-triphosphate reductase activating protein [endosymbiont of Ridgeia piscesae]KRT57167.1 pyruvate formate lyase activating enzyme [endosymbiont of Ridgeia piscesae]
MPTVSVSGSNRNKQLMSGSELTLRVGGLTPLTTVDYPGELAAVIFCQGCPWRCHYCHNPDLLPRQSEQQIPWDQILAFLQTRRGLLDAVVFSGGEPTLQRGLPDAIGQVKAMGFKVGLHSAGPYPERLRELLPLLDWIGLDIKALPEDYAGLTGVRQSGERAWESAALVIESGLPHQIRTTLDPALFTEAKQQRLLERLRQLGPFKHSFQVCNPVLSI